MATTTHPVRVPAAISVRWAAVGGAAFFALTMVNASLRTGAPAATDSAQDTYTWIADHQSRLQLDAVVLGFAMVAAIVLLAGLVRLLRRAEGAGEVAYIALGGGVLAAASTLLSGLIVGTLATRVDELGVDGIRPWWTMFMLSFGATLLGLLALIGATAIVAFQTHVFARWFAEASLVLALLSAAGAWTIGYEADGIQIVAGIAVLLDSVWILLVSYFLWRDREFADS